MNAELSKDIKARMGNAIEAFSRNLGALRTGSLSLSIFDNVKVDYYGTPTQLDQMASLSLPEPRTVVIQPWDITQLGPIEKAIVNSDLGFTPNNDGKIIRINVPQLTEERRKEIVKLAKKYAEESRVEIRNIRRDVNETAKKLEKDKELTQDELKKTLADIQEVTDAQTKNVEEILGRKEADIMEV
jgi:ribosome recycling factor